MRRIMNKIRLFHIMTSTTFWFAIAEIASAANSVTEPLPTLQIERFLIILAVIALMGILFYLLFRWWQNVEQSSYFGMRFRDTIKLNETSRLCAPIEAKWNRGTYLNEIISEGTKRAAQWRKDHERPEPKEELSKLARELGYEYELEDLKRNMELPRICMQGRNMLPGSGDGFSNMGDPWGTPPPWGNQIPGGTSPQFAAARQDESKVNNYRQERNKFKKDAEKWAGQVCAWAYQRYEEDLEEAKKEAEKLAKQAMGAADFSAIRGRGPEFVLEFTAVVVIIFAAVILGVGGQLSNEQIGTLLAAIAGYVLGKATTRGSSAPVQVVSDKTSEQSTEGGKQVVSDKTSEQSTEGGKQGVNDKTPAPGTGGSNQGDKLALQGREDSTSH